MKKKIGIGFIVASIIASAFVFAGGSKTDNNICPDRPDCICSKKATEQVVSNHPKAIVEKKANCPNTPNCICK